MEEMQINYETNNELESTFIYCIYKYPSINLEEFNEYYFNNLLEKLPMEKKTIFLLGDFIINLLEYEKHIIPLMIFWILCHQICFYHIFWSVLELTAILKLWYFSNFISNEVITGNFTTTISDHTSIFNSPWIFSAIHQ